MIRKIIIGIFLMIEVYAYGQGMQPSSIRPDTLQGTVIKSNIQTVDEDGKTVFLGVWDSVKWSEIKGKPTVSNTDTTNLSNRIDSVKSAVNLHTSIDGDMDSLNERQNLKLENVKLILSKSNDTIDIRDSVYVVAQTGNGGKIYGFKKAHGTIDVPVPETINYNIPEYSFNFGLGYLEGQYPGVSEIQMYEDNDYIADEYHTAYVPNWQIDSFYLQENKIRLKQQNNYVREMELPLVDTNNLSNRISAVANNLATHKANDIDTVSTNELQTIAKDANRYVTLSQNGGTFRDSVLTESQVDAYAENNGYLTNETDPTVGIHVKNITTTDITNWNNDNIGLDTSGQYHISIDKDLDSLNERQVLSIAGSVVSLNKGGGSITLPSGEATTVGDSPTIDLNLSGNNITGSVIDGSITPSKLSQTYLTGSGLTNRIPFYSPSNNSFNVNFDFLYNTDRLFSPKITVGDNSSLNGTLHIKRNHTNTLYLEGDWGSYAPVSALLHNKYNSVSANGIYLLDSNKEWFMGVPYYGVDGISFCRRTGDTHDEFTASTNNSVFTIKESSVELKREAPFYKSISSGFGSYATPISMGYDFESASGSYKIARIKGNSYADNYAWSDLDFQISNTLADYSTVMRLTGESNKAIINKVRISNLINTPTKIIGSDIDGDIGEVTLHPSISIANGQLKSNYSLIPYIENAVTKGVILTNGDNSNNDTLDIIGITNAGGGSITSIDSTTITTNGYATTATKTNNNINIPRFLRPVGVDSTLQYKIGDSLQTAIKLKINSTGNLAILGTMIDTILYNSPVNGEQLSADDSTNVIFKTASDGYRNQVGTRNYNTISVVPTLGTTTLVTQGITLTNLTIGAATFNAATLVGRQNRVNITSAATAGAAAYMRGTAVANITTGYEIGGVKGGGFYKTNRFAINDATLVAGARMFTGVYNSVANPTSALNPSTMVNCIGVGHLENQTTLSIYYGGSVAYAPINLGSNFPVAKDIIYELEIYTPPTNFVLGSNYVFIRVRNINSGKIFSTKINYDVNNKIPLNTVALNPIYTYRHNLTTAAAVSMSILNEYIETKSI